MNIKSIELSLILASFFCAICFAGDASELVLSDISLGKTKKVIVEPCITFEKDVYDFGDLEPEASGFCVFKFTNTGKEDLVIKGIISPCGCVVSELEKKRYAFAEHGEVKVELVAPKDVGQVVEHVSVLSNAKNKPKYELEVKAKVVPKIEVQPKELEIWPLRPNAGINDIALWSHDGSSFAISDVNSTDGAILADFDVEHKAKRFVLKPKVDIEKLKKQQFGSFYIELDHPECKRVSIPYVVIPEYIVSPSRIILKDAIAGKTENRKVVIKNNYDQGFSIESIESKNGYIRVLDKQKKKGIITVDLQIDPPEASGKSRYFNDSLAIKINGGHNINVRCSGWYKN
jgi:hypothetical protein